jgi:chemotaxis protein methyltransferase CheR
MTPEDFERLQVLMATRAGVRLARDRMQLAEHRLGPVARREGFETVQALLDHLWAKPVASLGWAVIEALLNTETWFRRDRTPFDSFGQELLPALARARDGGRVTVWSAGCSNGQEAYSLAMAALDARRKGLAAEVDITATDLSLQAIERARAGAYTGFEIQRGLSAATMLRWFEPREDMWVARRELREAVRFTRANLMDEPAEGARYDVIFCRHVLKDMEPARRALTLDMLERRLVDDGCLFVGFDERLDSESVAFRPVNGRRGLYVKSPAFLSRAA